MILKLADVIKSKEEKMILLMIYRFKDVRSMRVYYFFYNEKNHNQVVNGGPYEDGSDIYQQ